MSVVGGGGWMNSERWRCLWMNRTPWCGGIDELDGGGVAMEGWLNMTPWCCLWMNRTPIDRAGWGWMNKTRGGLDEQDHPVEGRMNSRRWRGARGGVVE